jgi:hypothetical protein
VLPLRRVIMFKKIAVRVSAVAFVLLAIALAPGVPTVLATVRTSAADDDAKLIQPLGNNLAQLSRVGFLIPLADKRTPRKLRGLSVIWPTT